jgi:valyl-tRNA synthetase
MALPKRYDPGSAEPRLQSDWQTNGVYRFDPGVAGPVYSIDTPPPTVSGHLHLGHVYSYSHADFMARYRRMRGDNVFYPMGYDDNGLPTERLVEKRLGITATQVGRRAFIDACLQVSEEAEQDYQALWQRLGLSIDWRFTYRTIDELSRRTSQLSFIELARKGIAYRREAPAIWCPECQTALAQADVNDLQRQSEFVTLDFRLEEGNLLPIATTRPELLPACVAIFVHPNDARYRDLAGRLATVPIFGQQVPVLTDPAADPQKGTGAVMCCTFGDTTDVTWWRVHHLPLMEVLDRSGRMTQAAGQLAGLTTSVARRQVKQALEEKGLILGRQEVEQSIRVHERCDTPVEFIVARQWFIRLLDHKQEFLEAGEKVLWHPEHMQARYRAWVENLNWDWCISRQRYFGVPFPVWYCKECGEVLLADEDQLPVDPTIQQPSRSCQCGSTSFSPERDIFDTWATSSMTPQIVGRWLAQGSNQVGNLYELVFPYTLRPQAHEIIRTWAFYTIVKSFYHFNRLPWKEVLISGWGVAGEGMGKISKSRGGGPMAPMEMINHYSADALRYWAASAGTGKDSVISEERIQMGARLVNKFWNVARFSERFLEGYILPISAPSLTPADRWLLSRLQQLVEHATQAFDNYEYSAAKNEIENFFWSELADNYLEMCKQRLYDEAHSLREGARYTLFQTLITLLKLLAPILPFITEEIYQSLFINHGKSLLGSRDGQMAFSSIHKINWPVPDRSLEDENAENVGEILVEIATAVRRYKSEHNLPLGTELNRLQLALADSEASLARTLQEANADLLSITRARMIEITQPVDPSRVFATTQNGIQIMIEGTYL